MTERGVVFSSVYNLFFYGQIACPDFSSGESLMVDNHISVRRTRHARFHIGKLKKCIVEVS